MTEIRLAHTCSVCKHAMFKKPNDWYYWGYGKKQLGICTALCDGDVPKVARDTMPRNTIQTLAPDRRYYEGLRECAIDSVLFSKEEFIHACKVAASETWETDLRNAVSMWREAAGDYDRMIAKLEGEGCTITYDIGASKSTYRRWKDEVTVYESRSMRIRQRRQWAKDQIRRPPYTDDDIEAWERHYDTFMENYWWWQENWPKARRCHRNCVCNLFEMENRREPVARSIAKGGYALHEGK